MTTIAVVDYGMGNRRSVEKALERVGARTAITRDERELGRADGLLLPGVGAFPAAMATIRDLGLDAVLCDLARAGVPLFGSCMGMQLLFDSSEEHGGAEGLGLLHGACRRLQAPGLNLPHIGWSDVRLERPSPLTDGLPNPTYLYHVHTYAPHPTDPEVVLGTAEYGERFATVVGAGRVFGCQSHPEKSSAHGLALLRNFVGLCVGQGAGGGSAASALHGADVQPQAGPSMGFTA
jgi:glutamine amidotransferase